MKALAAALLLLPTLAAAQTTLGPSLTVMGGGGADVSGFSCTPGHWLGFGVHTMRPFTSAPALTLHVVARGFWGNPGPSCNEIASPRLPPPDGVYDFERPMHLQAESYSTVDVRIGLYAPRRIAALTMGSGVAWRAGRDVPYVVAGLGFPAVDGMRHRFGFQVEYTVLLVTNDFGRETWQGGTMISQQRLRTVRHWRPAWTFGVRWGLPL